MMRIVWWFSFMAKMQGICTLGEIIYSLSKRDKSKNLQKVLGYVIPIVCILSTLVIAYKTWNQVQFQSPFWTVIGSIIFFNIAKTIQKLLR